MNAENFYANDLFLRVILDHNNDSENIELRQTQESSVKVTQKKNNQLSLDELRPPVFKRPAGRPRKGKKLGFRKFSPTPFERKSKKEQKRSKLIWKFEKPGNQFFSH